MAHAKGRSWSRYKQCSNCDLCSSSEAPLPRLNESRFVITYHSHNMETWQWTRHFLKPLRRLYRSHGCSFTVFTVLRNLLHRALSHWRHFGQKERFERSVEANADHQTRLLGGGSTRSACGPQMRGAACRRATRRTCDQPSSLEAARATLADMDIVGVFEEMNETLRLVSERSGIAFPRSLAKTIPAQYELAAIDALANHSASMRETTPPAAQQRRSHSTSRKVFAQDALSRLPPNLLTVLNATNLCDSELYHERLRTQKALSHGQL